MKCKQPILGLGKRCDCHMKSDSKAAQIHSKIQPGNGSRDIVHDCRIVIYYNEIWNYQSLARTCLGGAVMAIRATYN